MDQEVSKFCMIWLLYLELKSIIFAAKTIHFSITWKNQDLTNFYSVLVPFHFHEKFCGQNDTLFHYMEIPKLDCFQVSISILLHFHEIICGQIDTLFHYTEKPRIDCFQLCNNMLLHFHEIFCGQIDTLFDYMVY